METELQRCNLGIAVDSGKKGGKGKEMKTDLEIKLEDTRDEIAFITDELIRCEENMKRLRKIRNEKWVIWEGIAQELGYLEGEAE